MDRIAEGDPNVTAWKHDEATGLLTNKVYADGKGPVYAYTTDGKMQTRVWARGVVTTYSYTNTTGEMVGIDYSDSTPDVAFAFDRLGRQVTITDGQGSRSFGYDQYMALTNGWVRLDTPGPVGIRAKCGPGESPASCLSLTVNTLKIVIEQAETNVCGCIPEATLNLTSESYWGPSGVTWTSGPPGLAGVSYTDSVFTFDPSISTGGTYTVSAWADDLPCCSGPASFGGPISRVFGGVRGGFRVRCGAGLEPDERG